MSDLIPYSEQFEKIVDIIESAKERAYRKVNEQFNVMMEKGYIQAKTGTGLSVDEAFAKIREDI